MFGSRSVLATLFLSTALVSRPLVAQMGYATAVHTVSVTIPPRVKVQVSSFISSPSSSSIANSQPSGGVAVNVTATQPWTLSIGTTTKKTGAVKWSRSQQNGYASVSSNHATIASGAHGTTSADATLYLRADSAEGRPNDTDEAPVVLTMVAQ
jgi:hypothetical protein